MTPELGRILLIIGIVLVVLGGLAMLGVRLPSGGCRATSPLKAIAAGSTSRL